MFNMSMGAHLQWIKVLTHNLQFKIDDRLISLPKPCSKSIHKCIMKLHKIITPFCGMLKLARLTKWSEVKWLTSSPSIDSHNSSTCPNDFCNRKFMHTYITTVDKTHAGSWTHYMIVDIEAEIYFWTNLFSHQLIPETLAANKVRIQRLQPYYNSALSSISVPQKLLLNMRFVCPNIRSRPYSFVWWRWSSQNVNGKMMDFPAAGMIGVAELPKYEQKSACRTTRSTLRDK